MREDALTDSMEVSQPSFFSGRRKRWDNVHSEMLQLKITAAVAKPPSNTGLVSQTHNASFLLLPQQMTTNSAAWSNAHLSSHSFCGSEGRTPRGSAGCLPQGSQAEITVTAGLCSSLQSLRMSSFRLWADFTLWLQEWDPHFLPGHWPGIVLNFWRPLGLVPHTKSAMAGRVPLSCPPASPLLLPPPSAPSLWVFHS